ncbi:PP2C family protein-serine/threonine phosphatase [Streptomyces sp. NPDC052012]|uniref:PP2C family protein-serine/threonine phosphatase n=1 Tax=Streptomyces sp. NPDC052012 TaxID=3155051 RepID=UPI00344E35C7
MRRREPVDLAGPLQVRGHSVAWVPPVVLLAAIVVADYSTPGDVRVVPWAVLVPGVAATMCGVRETAVIAVLAIVTYAVVDGSWPSEYQEGTADFLLTVVGGCLATVACAFRVRRDRRMVHMRTVTEIIRRTVLRPLPPRWGGLDHAGVYLTAEAEADVGGDFYDIQPGPHGTRVLVGDVQGKGLGAVEAAAALLSAFREAAHYEPELTVVAQHLEARLLRQRGRKRQLGSEDGDRFATAVLVGFPVTRRDLVEMVVLGHEPPLAVSPRGVRPLPGGGGLPLGLGELAPGPPFLHCPHLARDETLLLCTDGVTEARDGRGAFYPLVDAVREAVTRDPGLAEPARLVDFVRAGTLEHSGGRLTDDTTVFAVRRLPETGGAGDEDAG